MVINIMLTTNYLHNEMLTYATWSSNINNNDNSNDDDGYNNDDDGDGDDPSQ